MPVEKTCQLCDDRFTVRPNREDEAKYCSRECYYEMLRQQDDQKVTVVCEWCAETYRVPPHKEDSTRFCSYECLGKNATEKRDYTKRVEIECEGCGEGFAVQKHRAGTASYCSVDCRRDRVTVECGECGVEYQVTKARRDLTSYCSRECKRMGSTNADETKYGPGWHEAKRTQIRERDGFRCQLCSMSQEDHVDEYGIKLHVHHITAARCIDNAERRNDPSNLVTLCASCHIRVEEIQPLLPAGLAPDPRSTNGPTGAVADE